MTPPGEITMINTDGKLFKAHPTIRLNSVDKEFLFNPAKQAFQYRVSIPGVDISMIVIDVTMDQLRNYLRTNLPVVIMPRHHA